MIKRITSTILACVMLCVTVFCGSITVSAVETSGECGDSVEWSYNSETGTLRLTGSGAMNDYEGYYIYVAPWNNYATDIRSISIDDGITYIGNYAFYNCENITEVILPESVTGLGTNVFSGCKSLKSVNLPETLEEIPTHLFYNCSALETVEIPDTVTKIGSGAFMSCIGLCELELPTGLEIIDEYAFFRCYELQNIDIPDGVHTIGANAFYQCTTLQSIELPESLTAITNDMLYNCTDLETIYIGSKVKSITTGAFASCDKLKSISVSEANESFSTDEYGALFDKDKTVIYLFPYSKTGAYIIPETVSKIESRAFASGMLESITVPDGVEVIKDETFILSYNLDELYLPESVTEIGKKAMYGCSLGKFEIPKSVVSIGEQAFYGCELLETVSISENVTFIGARALDQTGLKEINVDENNKYYSSDNGVLYNKAKSSLIKFPVNYEAETYEILDTTVDIQSYAFNECSMLKSFTIPLSVKVFNDYAFYDISNVYDIYYLGSPVEWALIDKGIGNYVLENRTIHYATDDIRSGKTLSSEWRVNLYDGEFYVGLDDMDDYSLTSPAPWNEFADKLKTITVGTYKIGDYAFYNCANATQATIYNDFERFQTIGKSAFENCESITEITIPNTVTVINERTFAGCKSLKTVIIEGELTSVAENAFAGCDALERVSVPQTEEKWAEQNPVIGEGNEAFTAALDFYVDPRPVSGQCGDNLYWEIDKKNMELKITGDGAMDDYTLHYEVPWIEWNTDVKSISLPDGLTEISRNAFWSFIEITACEIPDTVSEIGRDAFYNCDKLEYIEIPKGVRVISDGCFQSCGLLKTVVLPETVEIIGSSAFQGCISLTDVYMPNVIELGGDAFGNCDSLVRFDIPEKVVTIGLNIFCDCDNLEYVTIPASVTNIGTTPFDQCRKLKSITVDKNNLNYCSEDGVLYSKDKSVLICRPGGMEGPFVIPDTVMILRRHCMDGYFEETIRIPASVTDIEYDAFPLGWFTDVYYGGSEEQWNAINNEGGNDPLKECDNIHFNMSHIWPYTKTDMITVGNVTEFTVSTDRVPENNYVILACYKDGALVDIQYKESGSEPLDFTTDEAFDCVKVMVWENISSYTPVCGGEKIFN